MTEDDSIARRDARWHSDHPSSVRRPPNENDAPPAQHRLYIDERGYLKARWPLPSDPEPSGSTIAAGPSRAEPIRSARQRANVLFSPPSPPSAPRAAHPPSVPSAPPAAQPVLAPILPPPFEGYRTPRRHPLTAASLYNDDARPPILAVPKPHHVCSICLSVKSHPVSYPCGHSHCFVCVRLWLEEGWNCPDCGQKMFMPPFRHYGEEMIDFPSPPPRRVVIDLTDAP